MNEFMDEWMGVFDGKTVISGHLISSLYSFCYNIKEK